MADLNGFLSAYKRVIDAIPRLQDEAIESGDYTKVDAANETLERLGTIGKNIMSVHGVTPPVVPDSPDVPGLLGPTGQEGQVGPAGAPDILTPQAPAATAAPTTPAPNLLQKPQQQAPVVVNVQQAPQNQNPSPALLTPTPQESDFQKRRGAAKDTAIAAIRGLQTQLQSLSERDQDVSIEGFNYGPSYHTQLPFDAMLTELRTSDPKDYARIAERYLANAGVKPEDMPGLLRPIEGAVQSYIGIQGEPPAQTIAAKLAQYDAPALLKRDIELKSNIGAAEKAIPAAVSERQATEAKETAEFLKQRQAENAQRLGATQVPAILQQAPPLVTPTEVPEEEAMRKEFETRRAAEAQEPPPQSYEDMEKGLFTTEKPVVEPKKSTAAGAAPSYNPAEEFRARVLQELSNHPGAPKKKTFLDYLALILTGGKVAQIWNEQRSEYEQAKQKIGSEVYNVAKSKMLADEQHKRLKDQIDAANTRQDKTIAAQQTRQAIQLQAQKDISDGRNQLMWAMANLRMVPQHKKAQAQAILERIKGAQKDYDDQSRFVTSGQMSPERWNEAVKPIRENLYKLYAEYDRLVELEQGPQAAPQQPQK